MEAAKEQKREERERQQKSQDGRFSESSNTGKSRLVKLTPLFSLLRVVLFDGCAQFFSADPPGLFDFNEIYLPQLCVREEHQVNTK